MASSDRVGVGVQRARGAPHVEPGVARRSQEAQRPLIHRARSTAPYNTPSTDVDRSHEPPRQGAISTATSKIASPALTLDARSCKPMFRGFCSHGGLPRKVHGLATSAKFANVLLRLPVEAALGHRCRDARPSKCVSDHHGSPAARVLGRAVAGGRSRPGGPMAGPHEAVGVGCPCVAPCGRGWALRNEACRSRDHDAGTAKTSK